MRLSAHMETIVPLQPPSINTTYCVGEEEPGLCMLTGNVVRNSRSGHLSYAVLNNLGYTGYLE